MESPAPVKLVVTFRGQKHEFVLQEGLTAENIKARLTESELLEGTQLAPSDIKLLFKGKVLEQHSHHEDLLQIIVKPTGKPIYKMMAMGRSSNEISEIQQGHAQAMKRVPRVRDDLTKRGQRDMERRKRLGTQMLHKASAKASQPSSSSSSSLSFGFGGIQTLPHLPDEAKAREILTTLANDPGVLACMKKHKFRVGKLAELKPEGKVGESAICVMGLNRNKGQEILLRIRTDDLNGFRKILSIRKVLFHELAHNVHSQHDGQFFQLMRQIESECNAFDWTQGHGLSSGDGSDDTDVSAYTVGTYRLGGGNDTLDGGATNNETARELRARAALNRLTAEEEEIEQNCGCGQEAKFLPASLQVNRKQKSNADTNVDTSMDTSS